MPARDVASQDLVTVDPETSLSDAMQLMASYQVRRLPVVEDGERLIGVVSQADVALEAKEKTTGELVEHISRPPDGPRI
jgi:CBS-domain-containing membrane protein